MATRGRIQYQADGEHLIKGAKTFDIHPDLLEKIEEAGGGAIDTMKAQKEAEKQAKKEAKEKEKEEKKKNK